MRGQQGLFSRAELATWRDRTARRNYSREAEEFRRQHERHRAWGLERRHAEKLRRLREVAGDTGSGLAVERSEQSSVEWPGQSPVEWPGQSPVERTGQSPVERPGRNLVERPEGSPVERQAADGRPGSADDRPGVEAGSGQVSAVTPPASASEPVPSVPVPSVPVPSVPVPSVPMSGPSAFEPEPSPPVPASGQAVLVPFVVPGAAESVVEGVALEESEGFVSAALEPDAVAFADSESARSGLVGREPVGSALGGRGPPAGWVRSACLGARALRGSIAVDWWVWFALWWLLLRRPSGCGFGLWLGGPGNRGIRLSGRFGFGGRRWPAG
ncbi:hypothetical protein B0I29_12244 [Actinoplanes lutulentus]|uniref:Uncharacterized protein n=1 Tax=Actinoplanes lutulentus TaxID=1287878 RepID=A0A327Z0I6_9ACTN|nr:hypothetical protein B0I29_12244 [Actinoplanes lutulentus]